MVRMPGKTNKKLGDEEEELGEDAVAAIDDLDEEVEDEEVETAATALDEIDEDF